MRRTGSQFERVEPDRWSKAVGVGVLVTVVAWCLAVTVAGVAGAVYAVRLAAGG